MLESILSDGLNQLQLPYDTELLEKFRLYYTILLDRSSQMNLTAITEEDEVSRLHFLDCAAVLSQFSFSGKNVLDVGSGAGFPGLVLKLLCPSISLTLLDSTQKRVQFQQEVCAALGLRDVLCLHLRAEEAPPEMREHFDVVISRAVARYPVLAELCMPFVSVQGTFLAMKGSAAEDELKEGNHAVQVLGGAPPLIRHYAVPGLDAERALILSAKQSSTPKRYPRRFALIKKQPL